MKFTATAILSALLAAEAVVASPASLREKRLASREKRLVEKRASKTRHSQPKIAAGTEAKEINGTYVEYSSNWAGAVLISTGFTSVYGTVTVPSVSGSSGAAGAAWVGIDGDTCETAILQTGIQWEVGGSYSAWYEWYPDYSYDFTGITIEEGDEIYMKVTATSKTAGSATIENVTRGQTVTHTFSGSEDGTLCETNAEWIVEDFEECGSSCELVPFADFGTVTFTGAGATKSGSTVTASGATIIDIEQNSVLTSCSASGSTVTCKYV